MNSCVLGIGFILAFANVVGCTYETTEQVQAEMRDAGVIASDASGDDAMKKGWALQTEMTKGFAGPINVTQKTFDEPDMHTVTLGIKASGPYGGSADDNGRGYSPIPEAYATVAFTLNGVDFVRKFNIAQGTSVSGSAGAVTVQVEDNTVTAVGDPYPGYQITTSISPGARPNSETPPYYYENGYAFTIDQGGTFKVIPIPQGIGVKTVCVVSNAPPGGGANAGQYGGPGGGTLISGWDTGETVGVFLPILPNATTLKVTNLSATTGWRYSVVFGIDG